MKLSDSTYYTLRRLHSLSGIVPVGAFLLEHLATNAVALNGPAAYNRAVASIARLPFLTAIEIALIGLPLLFHMVAGVLIATTGEASVHRGRYPRNWMYLLQRVSGVFLAFFIIYHVWGTRLSPAAAAHRADLYQLMQQHLQESGVLAIYLLGTVAACFHFGNGLFGFAIHWGLATTRDAQRRAARLGFAVFVILALVGVDALLSFTNHPLRLFGHPPDTFALHAPVTP
jgi:succinate dehydrogenase / fumarate reductase cytochrome b subunit